MITMKQNKEKPKTDHKFSNQNLNPLSGKTTYTRWMIINFETGETELDINNDPD